jgi:hypothetical protein
MVRVALKSLCRECTRPEQEDQEGNDHEVPFKLTEFGLVMLIADKNNLAIN